MLFTLGQPTNWDDAQIVVHSFETGERKVLIEGGKVPANFKRLDSMLEQDHHDREALRSFLSKNFLRQRRVDRAEAYNLSHARVRGLMASEVPRPMVNPAGVMKRVRHMAIMTE